MESIWAFFSCVGFMVNLIPLVLCIVLWGKLHDLRRRMGMLEMRLADMARDMMRRPVTAPAPYAATSPPSMPLEPERRAEPMQRPAPVRPAAEPAVPVKPMVPPISVPLPAAPTVPVGGTAERLREKIEEVRPREPVHAVAPVTAHAMAQGAPVRAAQLTGSVAGAPDRKRLEQFLGTKLIVVIGAICLGLAGIFLVKIGIERGVFGPGMRVFAGVAAGVALLALGQWRRMKEGFIAQGLSAAGIVALFAAIFAATTLYHFLMPQAGFVLLACVTAAAVAMSLQKWSGRSGMLIATLGLIGGFLTPVLVSTGERNAPGLFGYLLLLHVGLVVVTRMRGWTVLAGLSVLFSSVWLIFWMLWWPWKPEEGAILGTFMLGSVVAMVVGSVQSPEKWKGGGGQWGAQALTWLSGGMGLLAACMLLGRSSYSDLEWGFFAALVAGGFVLGRMRRQYEALAWVSALAVLAMLAVWGLSGAATLEHGLRFASPAELARFRWWIAGLGIASVPAAYGCQWGSAAPVRWGLLCVLLAAGYVGVAYGVLGQDSAAEWAYLPAAAAVVLSGMAVPVFLRRGVMRTGEATLAVFGHGVLGMLMMAAPIAWSGGTLTAAWCLLLPVTALAVWRLRMPGMLIGFLCVMCAVAVRGLALGLLMEAGGAERTLWWNPVVWTYGSILVAMGLSAWLLERCAELPAQLRGMLPEPRTVSALLQAAATAAGFMLLTLEVRWYFHGGKLNELAAALTERATFAVGWMAMSCALVFAGQRMGRSVMMRCGQVVGAIGMLYTLVVLVGVTNPLWWGDAVGARVVFNELLCVYGMPAALCGVLSLLMRRAAGPHDSWAGRISSAVGLLLLGVMVSLQVRQGFQGEHLNEQVMGFAERGTYAIAWLALGGILLALGYRFADQVARRAGLLLVSAGLGFAVVVCAVAMNPLWWHEAVGTLRVFNWLLYAYGVPAAAAGVLCAVFSKRQGTEKALMHLSAVAGLFLMFVLVTLEVQHWFRAPHGLALGYGAGPFGEMTAYSLAWALLGGIYLAAGIWRGNTWLRWASLVMLMLTVVKVFIFDMADLKDLERVFSFAGLGISLMVIAFVYQRFVFRRVPEKAAAA